MTFYPREDIRSRPKARYEPHKRRQDSFEDSVPQDTFKLTRAQDRAMDSLISDALHCALGGGSRCVAANTIVDGTGHTIEQLAQIGAPVRVRTTYGTQQVPPPEFKGSDELLRFTLPDRLVDVTDDHRFWDGHQWVYARDLRPGDLIAVSLWVVPSSGLYPQASSLAPGLSRSLLSARRLKRKALDLMGRCFGYPRRYGRRLRQALGGGPIDRASLCDARAHTHDHLNLSYHDELGPVSGSRTCLYAPHVEGCSHFGRPSYPPSSKDGSHLSYPVGVSLARVFSQICGLFQGLRGVGQQVGLLCAPLRLIGLTEYNWRRRWRPCVYHESFGDTPNRKGYRLEKVLDITKTAKQDYYSFYVPGCEQYFANGVLHHNSGKTFLLVRAALIRALKEGKTRHAIFRFTFASIKASVIYDTLPKVIDLCFPQLKGVQVNKTDWYMTLPNGSEIWFGGLDDKERTEKILGQEYATIYFNECSQIPWGSIETAHSRLAQKTSLIKLKAYYDFNPPSKKHWTYLFFVEKKNPLTKQPLPNPLNNAFFLINPADNAENISTEYMAILQAMSPKKRDRFLLGKFADTDEGALWTEQLLIQNRVLGNQDLPDFMRIVVAVDPSGCKGPEDFRSDEVGIVVCALGTDSHGYLVEDLSGRYSPEQWSNIAVEAFRRHRADAIVGEVNYGGDMVRAIIHAQDANIPYKEVHASRGKVIRAEPISHLYEQQKVHHIGHFYELEDQLCSFNQEGYVGLRSPDRADAAIWGLTELFPAMTRKVDENVLPSKVVTRKRSASRLASGGR